MEHNLDAEHNLDVEDNLDVIVIGAGIAGLTAAATAAAAGSRVLVLDRQAPGGRATSDERNGYRLNRGAHALYRGGQATGVLKRLGIEVTGKAPRFRHSQVLVDGELRPLPTEPKSLASCRWLDARDKLQFGAITTRLTIRAGRRAAGLGETRTVDWLDSLELRPRIRLLVEGLVRVSSYCADFELLSADVAALQVGLGIRPGVRYLDGGWQQLVTTLVDRAGRVSKARVETLAGGDGNFAVTTDIGIFRSRSVVVAVESEQAAQRLIGSLGRSALRSGDPAYAVTNACLDIVTPDSPDPDFLLGIDEPTYLSHHSVAADFRVPIEAGTSDVPLGRTPPPGPASTPDRLQVVHLMRYGARSHDLDRPALENLAARAGLDLARASTARFLADMTVVSAAPTAATGGLKGRPGIEAPGIAGCYVAGDWVGPAGFLADASFSSGEQAGRAAHRTATGVALSRRRSTAAA